MTVIELPIFADGNLLTHSCESTFRACPRRYALRYVHGLKPAHDGDALRIGSAFHGGLEIAKGGGSEDEAVKAVRDIYADATCPPWLEPEDFAVEQEMAVGMVRAWVRRWTGDSIVNYVAVEVAFDLPLINPHTGRPHPHYRNAGKIDGIAELPDGRLAIVEHKTSGDDIALGGDYWKRLLLDSQISRYWLAAHAMGFAVQTVIYDVIRKPLIRPKKVSKADREQATFHKHYCGLTIDGICPERETPKMFGARVTKEMTDDPGRYFARAEIPRLEIDLEDFRRDQWSTLKAIQACEADGYWPRNTAACTSPYACQFLDVCRGMRGDPDEQVPDGYVRASVLHPELATEVTA